MLILHIKKKSEKDCFKSALYTQFNKLWVYYSGQQTVSILQWTANCEYTTVDNKLWVYYSGQETEYTTVDNKLSI